MPSTSGQHLLFELLCRVAPNAHWIRGFLASHFGEHALLAELPSPDVSVAQYAREAASRLFRHNMVDEPLLDAIVQTQPSEAACVNDIRRALAMPMRIENFVSFDLLTDNWLYQDIAELFAEGPRDDDRSIPNVGEELTWTSASWTGIALESLLSVLCGIVLRDRFMVEEKFIDAWIDEASPVHGLYAGGILCPITEPDNLGMVRSQFYREFFQAPSLARWHRESITTVRAGSEVNPYVSAVLWGSIGYLARSSLLGVTYVGHPVRRRFLAQTPIVQPDKDAAERAMGTVDAVRLSYLAAMEDATTRMLRFVVPPLLVDIIENSVTREDLVLVALQYREEYRKLRQWLGLFQRALDADDRVYVMECEEMLKTVKISRTGPRSYGALHYDVASRTIHTLSGLHRPAAVILERLACTPHGERAIDHLLELFDVAGTTLEMPVLTHIRTDVMFQMNG